MAAFYRWRENILAHPMWIIAHAWFEAKVTGSVVTSLGPKDVW